MTDDPSRTPLSELRKDIAAAALMLAVVMAAAWIVMALMQVM